MPIRVVYSDLDGTMVGPHGCFFRATDGSLTLDPARALVDVLAAGVDLVLVSGRTRPQLVEAARIFGADGFVGELGAVLGWDSARSARVLRGAMPVQFERYGPSPVDVLGRLGVVERLLERYDGRLEYHSPWHEGHEADVMLRGHVDAAEVERQLAAEGFGWLRLHDNGVLAVPPAERPYPVHVYHLMPAGLSKGLGVAADLERRGLRPADAIAIGDSLSDLQMAAHVRRFFLTANGASAPAVRAAAERIDNVTICHAPTGAGWTQALRWALSAT